MSLKFYKGAGCSVCNDTGYKGRVAIYEVMSVGDELKKTIMLGSDSNKIKEIAVKEGMNSLRMAAVLKMEAGLTTLDEVLRATAGD